MKLVEKIEFQSALNGIVRNLGLHNRWEIDDLYKSQSLTKELVVGNIRHFTVNELREWQEGLNSLIHETSMKVAILYKDVPEFND